MPDLITHTRQNGSRTSGMVTHTIKINDEKIPSAIPVYSIDIWRELNHIPRAKVFILDGSAADETFKISEDKWFIPGNSIEIQLGYQSDETKIFKGIVTGQSIKMRSNGNSILTVECADPAVKMTTIPKSHYFYDSTESEVFEAIIGNYSNLSAEVDPTSYTHGELLQFQATDWDFILSRAEINGLFCNVEDGTVAIKKPDFNQKPAEALSYGHNLLEMDAEMDGSNQVGAVTSISWDYSKTEPSQINGSSSAISSGNLSSAKLSGTLENDEWTLRAGGKIPNPILQSWGDAKLMRHELAKIRGRAKVRGLPTVKPGSVVKLEGVGDRFNGKAFVSGVKHNFYKGEWVMDVQFGLSSEWFSEQYDISSDPAAGMLPSISGLQIGLVTQIEGDPNGDERMLVRLPMIDTEEQGVWARLGTAGAGNNRGVIIRPEIDDEVVVGFIHGDPNQPIILGSLNSANNPAPITGSDDNNEKGWVSRGEVKMMLNDDDPSVNIEMPSGKKVIIDDNEGEIRLEDEYGNKVQMNSDGVSLKSGSDITIEANGDIKLKGINVEANANAGFKAEGTGSAEVTSSGSTSIKGSIVQIN